VRLKSHHVQRKNKERAGDIPFHVRNFRNPQNPPPPSNPKKIGKKWTPGKYTTSASFEGCDE